MRPSDHITAPRDAHQRKLSEGFSRALSYTAELHSRQLKKGTGAPYIAHLMGVASLVLEAGGDEDLAIAALLHDAAEDQGGRPRLEEIRQKFGERVAHVVAGCTDTYDDPKPAWRPRKEAYIRHVRHEADEDVLLVSACDKLYNSRAILHDYRYDGEPIFRRFSGGRDGSLWYYRTLVSAYREAIDRLTHAPKQGLLRVIEDLDRTVTELEALVESRKAAK